MPHASPPVRALNLLDPHSLLASAGALGVFLVLFAETGLLIGFFLPGDSLLFTAGLLCATARGLGRAPEPARGAGRRRGRRAGRGPGRVPDRAAGRPRPAGPARTAPARGGGSAAPSGAIDRYGASGGPSCWPGSSRSSAP